MSNIFSLSIIFVILLYPLIFSTITSIILLWTFFLEHSITRVELLQKQQITSLDRFRQQAKELKVTVGKDLEEASVDSAGMFFAELYCTVLYCTMMYYIAEPSTIRYDTIRYCSVLFSVISSWSILKCNPLYIIFNWICWLGRSFISPSIECCPLFLFGDKSSYLTFISLFSLNNFYPLQVWDDYWR